MYTPACEKVREDWDTRRIAAHLQGGNLNKLLAMKVSCFSGAEKQKQVKQNKESNYRKRDANFQTFHRLVCDTQDRVYKDVGPWAGASLGVLYTKEK